MTPRRHRTRAAWALGLLVLAALAFVSWRLVARARGEPAPGAPRVVVDGAAVDPIALTRAAPMVGALPTALLPADDGEPVVGELDGVVRGADGRLLPGATVTLYRATTAWPEWQRERLARALVGADGAFRFRATVAHGLLVGVEHPQHAELLVDAALGGPPLDLRLAPGFPLAGVVRTESGAPLANARVAVESVVGDDRRARVAVTTSAGAFTFANLAAGPARVVVRHPSWQPSASPVVVLGEQQRVELRVARPALAPLRGVVVSVETRAPVADATVELLATSAQLGLADPHATRTAADGGFTIAGLPRSVMRLVVRHPAFGAVVRAVPVGVAEAPIDVELPRRTAVAGELDAARGNGAATAGATLRLRDLAGQVGFTTVAPDGTFRFGGDWSPGPAELRVVGGGFMFSRVAAPVVETRLDEAATTELGYTVAPPFGVRGRVVDERGAPIAGASVSRTATANGRVRMVGAAAAQFDITGFGRGVAQLLAGDRDEPVAVTGADGAFAIPGVGTFGVAVRAPGRATVAVDATCEGPLARAEPMTIALPPAASLRGQALRAGLPFAGAQVLAYRGDDPVASALTDADGAWSIDGVPPGEYRLRARNPAQATPGEFRVASARPGGGAPVVLQLAPPRLVRGQVVARGGQPLPGVAVSLRRGAGASVVTGGDGAFAIEAPERAGELQIAQPDRAGVTFAPIPAGGGLARIVLDAPPSCAIAAQVVALPGRRRLGAVLLRVTSADDEPEAGRGAWFDLVDGELAWSGCPAGRVRIEVWCEGHAPTVLERELEAGKAHDLGEILLERGARLRGVVVGPDGRPIAGAQMLLGDEADFEAFDPTTRSGPDGAFELHGVSGRSSRLVVRAAGFAPTVVDLALPADVLSPRPLRIALQAGAVLEALVARDAARTAGFVQVRRDGRFVANLEIDEAGVAVAANLPPGRYELSLLGDDRPAKAVTIAPGALRADVQLP